MEQEYMIGLVYAVAVYLIVYLLYLMNRSTKHIRGKCYSTPYDKKNLVLRKKQVFDYERMLVR